MLAQIPNVHVHSWPARGHDEIDLALVRYLHLDIDFTNLTGAEGGAISSQFILFFIVVGGGIGCINNEIVGGVG